MDRKLFLIASIILCAAVTTGCSESGNNAPSQSTVASENTNSTLFKLEKAEWKEIDKELFAKVAGAEGDEILITDWNDPQKVLGLFKLEKTDSQSIKIELATGPCEIRAVRIGDGTSGNLQVKNAPGNCGN